MIGAGTVINPIVKIVTTIVILAAVGIFIVKPVLETTEKVANDANRSVARAQQQSQQASRNAELDATISRTRSFIQSLASSWPAAARATRACMQKAEGAIGALNACERFAERLVHSVQSDRSFALSYADSLAAQGRTAEAARVTSCVKEAGFETAPMQRCRNLADELLFG